MKGYTGTTPTVDAIGKLHITGNMIPRPWMQWLKRENGKPNTVAIMILSEICYWYRPVEISDEKTGRVIGWRKKFKADKLQKSYQDLADSLGFTKRQTSDAVAWLEERGLITKELRHFSYASNVLFLEPVASEVERISFSIPVVEHLTPEREMGHVITGDDATPKRETYTEITDRNYKQKFHQTNNGFQEKTSVVRSEFDFEEDRHENELQSFTTGDKENRNSEASRTQKKSASQKDKNKIPLHGQKSSGKDSIGAAIFSEKRKIGHAVHDVDRHGVVILPSEGVLKLPYALTMRSMQYWLYKELESDGWELSYDLDEKTVFGCDKDDWVSDESLVKVKQALSLAQNFYERYGIVDEFNEAAVQYFSAWVKWCNKMGARALPVVQKYGVARLLDLDLDVQDFSDEG